MARLILICGGGIAGLSLGILLRRQGVPVELWDAAGYPRHRVCGEFISGRGVDLIHRMNLGQSLLRTAHTSRSVRFFTNGLASREMPLPRPALAMARAELDELLATQFVREGGKLHEGRRWADSFEMEGLVRATGRRLDHRSPRQDSWIGLKVHARGFPVSSDLDLHFSNSGYVGIARLNGNRVNICALIRQSEKFSNLRSNYRSYLEDILAPAAAVHFNNVEVDEPSFSAVAGITLRHESPVCSNECRIGDSICMIPPFTGNGMSLALESAALAAPVLAAYSRGEVGWTFARQRISQKCDRAFHRRLFVSSFLQKISIQPRLRGWMMSIFQTAPILLKPLFLATR